MSFYNTNPVIDYTQSMYYQVRTSAHFNSTVPPVTRPYYHHSSPYHLPANTYSSNIRQPTVSHQHWLQGDTTLTHPNPAFTPQSDHHYKDKNTVDDQNNSNVYYKAPTSPTNLFISKASRHAISVTSPQVSPRFKSALYNSPKSDQELKKSNEMSSKEKRTSNASSQLPDTSALSLVTSNKNKDNSNALNTVSDKADLFFERAWRLGITCSEPNEKLVDSPKDDKSTCIEKQQSAMNSDSSQSDEATSEKKMNLHSRESITNPVTTKINQLESQILMEAKSIADASTFESDTNIGNDLGRSLCLLETPTKTQNCEPKDIKSCPKISSLNPNSPEFKPGYTKDDSRRLSRSLILPFQKIPLLPEDEGEEKMEESNDFYSTEDSLYTGRNVDVIEMKPYVDELVDDQTQTDAVELKDMEAATDTMDTLSKLSQTDEVAPTTVKLKIKNRRLQTGPELMPPQPINLPININYKYLLSLQKEVYHLRGQMCLSELQRELHSLNYSKSHWSLFFQSQANTDTGLQDLVDSRMKLIQQSITNIEGLLKDGLARLDNGENLKDLPELSVYIPTVSGNTRYFPLSVMKDIDFELHPPEASNEEKTVDKESDSPKCAGVEVSTQTDLILEESRTSELILKEPEWVSNAKKRKKVSRKAERKLNLTLVTIDEGSESLEDELSSKDLSIDSVENNDASIDSLVNNDVNIDSMVNKDVSIDSVKNNDVSIDSVVNKDVSIYSVENNDVSIDSVVNKDVSIYSLESNENTCCLEEIHSNEDIASVQITSSNNSDETVIVDLPTATNNSFQVLSQHLELNVSERDQKYNKFEIEAQNDKAVSSTCEINSVEKKNLTLTEVPAELEKSKECAAKLEKSKEDPSNFKKDVECSNTEHLMEVPNLVNQGSKCDDQMLLAMAKTNMCTQTANLMDQTQKQETNYHCQNAHKYSEEKQDSGCSVKTQESIQHGYDPAILKAPSADDSIKGINCQSHTQGIQNTSLQQSNDNFPPISASRHIPIPQINQDIFRAVKTQLIRDYPQLVMNPFYLENLAINQSLQLQNFIAMETYDQTVIQQTPSQIPPATCLQQAQNRIQVSHQAKSAPSVPPGLKGIQNIQPSRQQSSGHPSLSSREPSMQKSFFDSNTFTSTSPVKLKVSQESSKNASTPCVPTSQPSPQVSRSNKNQTFPPRMFSQHPEVSQLPASLIQYQLPFHGQPQKIPSRVLPQRVLHPWSETSGQRSPSPKLLTTEDQVKSTISQQVPLHNSSAFVKDLEAPAPKSGLEYVQVNPATSQLQLSPETVCSHTVNGKKQLLQQSPDPPKDKGAFIHENNTSESGNFVQNEVKDAVISQKQFVQQFSDLHQDSGTFIHENNASSIFESRKAVNSHSPMSTKTSGTKTNCKFSASQHVEPHPKSPDSVAQDDWESEIELFPETFQFNPQSLSRKLNFQGNIGLDDVSMNQLASRENRPKQTKLNKAFLGRLLNDAGSHNSRKPSTKQNTQDNAAEDFDAYEKPVDTWQTVSKKKDKKGNKTVNSKQTKSADVSGARANSQLNFENLVQLLLEKIENITRPDVLFAVSEIRKKRGSLKGMPILEIIDSAKTILRRKKSQPTTDGNVRGYHREQMVETLPRFKQNALNLSVVSVEEEGEVCVICCDELTMEKTKHLDCGHEFHINCIKEWVYKHERTCPTCRQIALFPEEFPCLKTPHK